MVQLLFSLTLLISAALLFWIQLLTSKLLLPILGGSAAVWNTCIMFFQIALLFGYLYAHLTARWGSRRFRIFLHPVLLGIAALTLPISLDGIQPPTAAASPVLWVLATLLVIIGAPFCILAGTAPLVQAWFAETRARSSRDPYFLYAASNFGSLAALMFYPTIIEPQLHLAQQARLWTIGYYCLIGLILACAALVVAATPRTEKTVSVSPDHGAKSVNPTVLTRLRWLLLAFTPSSLLLGVTAHLTTDIAAAPLFWVVPLILYLLSFVFAFQRLVNIPEQVVTVLQAILLVAVGSIFLTNQTEDIIPLFGVHLTAFFMTALLCHQELARLRPSTQHLTEFYLLLSLGGALGGTFNALVAPNIFNDVVEYPLMLVVACLLRPGVLPKRNAIWPALGDFAVPVSVFTLVVLLYRYANLDVQELSASGSFIVMIICALVVFAWQRRPVGFGLGVAALIAAGLVIANNGDVLQQTRNFYGVLKVVAQESPPERILYNGTTLHGAQATDAVHRLQPLSYYHPDGPLGQLFAVVGNTSQTRRVGIVGLGIGTVACYGQPNEHWTYFEINPADIAIAQNPALFTFLRECPVHPDIVRGDARLSLAVQPDHSFNMIIFDAFTSDAIPIHLMTRNAMEMYLQKLQTGGWLVYHVSNQNLNLGPVVGNIAASLNLTARRFNDEEGGDDETYGKDASDWIVVARRPKDLSAIATDNRWQLLLPSAAHGVWTDDYSNVLGALLH